MRACVLGCVYGGAGPSSNSISLHVMVQVRGCVTTGVIYCFSPLAIFPPEKIGCKAEFTPEKSCITVFFPRKADYIVGVSPFYGMITLTEKPTM